MHCQAKNKSYDIICLVEQIGVDLFMDIYQRIRDLREDKDITQAEIANMLHMQREVYRRYETGQREIPLNIAVLIANLYNVSLDYITGRTDKKEINK